jgi:hypothetical protein
MLGTLAAIQAAGQLGYGIYQTAQARKLREQLGKQPKYDFDYAKRAAAGTQNLAQGEMPGVSAQRQTIDQLFANASGNIMSMAPSGAAATAANVQNFGSLLNAARTVEGEGALQRLALQQQGLSAIGGLQSYADQAFQANQLGPYTQNLGRINELQAAGFGNISGGIQSGVSALGSQVLANQLKGVGSSTGVTTLSKDQVAAEIKDKKAGDYTYDLYKSVYESLYPDLFK